MLFLTLSWFFFSITQLSFAVLTKQLSIKDQSLSFYQYLDNLVQTDISQDICKINNWIQSCTQNKLEIMKTLSKISFCQFHYCKRVIVNITQSKLVLADEPKYHSLCSSALFTHQVRCEDTCTLVQIWSWIMHISQFNHPGTF